MASSYQINFNILVVSILVLFVIISCSPSEQEKEPQEQKHTLSGIVRGMTSDKLVLELNGSENLSLTGDGLFSFQTGLDAGEQYVVVMTISPLQHVCEIENGTGAVGPGTTKEIIVNCRPSSDWRHPASLQDSLSLPGLDSREPVLAMDPNGNAVVAWTQSYEDYSQIYLAEFRNYAWLKPRAPDSAISLAGGEAKQPSVAVAANGDAVIAWQQKVGESSHIYMAEKRAGSWRLPSSLDDHISPGKSYAWEANVAMDDAGNTIIVWDQEYTQGYHQVYKSEYRQGAWQHPESLEDYIGFTGGDGVHPLVVMNNQGQALITWEQDPESQSRIYKSEFRQGAWSHPVDMYDHISPKSVGGGAYNAIPALNEKGDAIIAWQQAHGSSSRIYKSEYRKGSWQHPTSLDESISPSPPTSATLTGVAMDNEGNSLLLWNLQEMGRQKMYLSAFLDGTWVHPGEDDSIVGPGRDFAFGIFGQIAIAGNGKALLAWQQMGDDRFSSLYFEEIDKGTLALPGNLLNIENKPVSSFTVSSSPKENFIIAWQQSDGANDRIYCSVFRGVE